MKCNIKNGNLDNQYIDAKFNDFKKNKQTNDFWISVITQYYFNNEILIKKNFEILIVL